MNQLYKDLEQLSVPTIEDINFQNELRRSLLKHHFTPHRSALRLRVAIACACVLAIFGFATIINPDIAYRLNQIAFGADTKGHPGNTAGKNYAGLQGTSLQNPDIAPYFPVQNFQEEKAYVIRKYTSPKNGAVMVVSEFGNKPVKMIQTGGY